MSFIFKLLLYGTAAAMLLHPRGGTLFYILEIRYMYLLLLSFFLTYILTSGAIYLGEKFNLKDYPDKRKLHKKPVPLTGGIAVFSGFLITIARNMVFTAQIRGVLLGALLIFILGLLDDKYSIPATVKLLFQLGAATVLIAYGIRVRVVPYGVPFKLFWDVLITYFGVIGITNAFNYMDGMNGEAAGLGVISSATLFFIAHTTGAREVSWLAIALAGSAAGFLPHNFPRAKLFLGDNGSTLMGFLLASIAIAGSWGARSLPVAVVTPLLIFSLYIFDMIYTTISRVRNKTVKNLKEWFEYTARDHMHHRLEKLGFSKTQAVIVIWLTAIIFGFSAFVIRDAGTLNAFLIMSQSLLIYLLIAVLMYAGRNYGTDI